MKTARSVRIEEFGGPEKMSVRTIALPPPGEGEIQLRQTAVGLNFIDVYQRRGVYPLPLPTVSAMKPPASWKRLAPESIVSVRETGLPT